MVVYVKPPVLAVRATDTMILITDVCPAGNAKLVKVDVPLYVTVIPVAGATLVVTV